MNSFQAAMKASSPVVTMPGSDIGRMIEKRMPKRAGAVDRGGLVDLARDRVEK